MGQISVNNGNGGPSKLIRPAWIHGRKDVNGYPGYENASLEMLESIRNVLEQIQRSQMLECSVAHNIYAIRRTLERIDRRLAKTHKLGGAR